MAQPLSYSQLHTPTKTLLQRSETTTFIPASTKDVITAFIVEAIYDIEENQDHALIFRGAYGFRVYPRIGLIPVNVYTNNTVRIGYPLLPEDIITLGTGATTTISNTAMTVGTNAVTIGRYTLPMNLEAIPSISSASLWYKSPYPSDIWSITTTRYAPATPTTDRPAKNTPNSSNSATEHTIQVSSSFTSNGKPFLLLITQIIGVHAVLIVYFRH
jgi:hypothetical protein